RSASGGRPRRAKRGRLLRIVREWDPWEIKLLGQAPDPEVARKTGRTLKSIRHKRTRLGILWRPAPPRWTAADKKLLGRLTDFEVARRLGRSVTSVTNQRTKFAIPYVASSARPWTRTED